MSRRTLQEQIDRMKYISKYHLKEASYKAVLSDELNSSEDDVLSKSMYSGIQPQSNDSTEVFDSVNEDDLNPDNFDPMASLGGEQSPSGDTMGMGLPSETGGTTGMEAPAEPLADPMADPLGDNLSSEPLSPVDSGENNDVDKKQTDLLSLQLDVMNKLNDKIKELDSIATDLNSKYQKLNQDVEEVREPTDSEKLASRKKDSHPFYYNLNDMWQDNHFQARRDQYNEKGIVKLDNGTFVADFDNLPKLSDKDVRDSFLYYESVKKKSKIITESSSDTYFNTLSEALDNVREYALSLGVEIDEDALFNEFGTGGISYGQTKKGVIPVLQNGKPLMGKSGKELNRGIVIAIYRMDNGKYELVKYKTW